MTDVLDLRAQMFNGLPWFHALTRPPAPRITSAWYVAKDQDAEWNVCLLEAALQYAKNRGLWSTYRRRFEGIGVGDVSLARANAENREADFVIWEIAAELVAAAYLEHVLRWTFCRHEPPGDRKRLGDWEFETPDGKLVFVEVKTLCEPQWRPTSGGYFRRSQAGRLGKLLSRAYRKLPADDRATLVVVVGFDLIRIPFSLVQSDLFASLFGQFVVKFNVMTPAPQVTYAGPSFREMLVGHTKRRRLGVVAGLVLRGLSSPMPLLYSLHNPFAYDAARIGPAHFADCPQFVWSDRLGEERGRNNAEDAWRSMQQTLLPVGPCTPIG